MSAIYWISCIHCTHKVSTKVLQLPRQQRAHNMASGHEFTIPKTHTACKVKWPMLTTTICRGGCIHQTTCSRTPYLHHQCMVQLPTHTHTHTHTYQTTTCTQSSLPLRGAVLLTRWHAHANTECGGLFGRPLGSTRAYKTVCVWAPSHVAKGLVNTDQHNEVVWSGCGTLQQYTSIWRMLYTWPTFRD